MRVTDLTVGHGKVRVIGDPHLGRVFKTGVPLERRGEREEMVWTTFADALMAPDDVDLIVIMGDIFDKMLVSNAIVLRACDLIANCECEIVVLRGNHDASRDLSIKSSFDVLAALLDSHIDVEFVTDLYITELKGTDTHLAFFGWHPFITAAEMVFKAGPLGGYDAVFGHWDVTGDSTNLIPAEALSLITDWAITGHDHTPREFHTHGLKVTVVGSMQPYSHAEDPDQQLYVTLTSEQYAEMDHTTLTDKNVRVCVLSGGEVPEPCNCLSFVIKRIDEEEDMDMSVSIDSFDMLALFKRTLIDNGVSDALQNEILDRYKKEVVECSDA